MQTYQNMPVIGALELCNLPELAIQNLNIRVDTGATTSSLHVDDIEEFEKDGETWVSFNIHPDIHDVNDIVRREAKVEAVRKVKSSTATRERRYLIETLLEIAGASWKIHLSLTDRSEMTYLMLLGREAMSGRLVVNPGEEYLLGTNP
ncbi:MULTISPECIES: ATP-dependent zinc protease family protein [Aliiglaciecola]|uniref:ATP-dependent zinc protease family protein n=1 Tax=Aliiglaciecola TaxID=1406885 RepID=UPI001C083D70|nr:MULTISPECIES: ATP-dependent zinc protease [Aliiglaciecola]MBU2878811.1 ATP-dependent zinc protease [Aliiglaciecola lipolytica]MDO6711291.1 ATP-dependent zinc protease [Aliiglaciecola sp. 2_MG-2023]MDO6752260.1 ATP-dependent zinc protease [Aliiglaciecola sp. 1_MG-2023]